LLEEETGAAALSQASAPAGRLGIRCER
jgi:hypothetical protein